MSEIIVPDFKEKIARWINGIRMSFKDKNYRTLQLVSGETNRLDIMYSISYLKTYNNDDKFIVNIFRAAKLLMHMPMIIGRDYLKEDTICILTVNVIDVLDNIIKLKYDISVCNGSSVHKNIVRKMELADLSVGIKLPVGFSISEQYIMVDLKQRQGFVDKGIVSIKDVCFNGKECSLIY